MDSVEKFSSLYHKIYSVFNNFIQFLFSWTFITVFVTTLEYLVYFNDIFSFDWDDYPLQDTELQWEEEKYD